MKKLSRDELVELVRKISNHEFRMNDDYVEAIELFQESVPDPDAIHLIFQLERSNQFQFRPKDHEKHRLTPEEVVDTALNYKPT